MQSAVADYSNAFYNIVQDGGRIESDHRPGADFEKENGKLKVYFFVVNEQQRKASGK